MAIRIEVSLNPRIPDARGRDTAARARRFLRAPVTSCRTRDVYKVDMPLSTRRRAQRVRAAFTDPGHRPRGRRPAAAAALRLADRGRIQARRDRQRRPHGPRGGRGRARPRAGRTSEEVYTSTQYFLRGAGLTREDAERLGARPAGQRPDPDHRACSRPRNGRPRRPDTEPSRPSAKTAAPAVAHRTISSGPDEELLRISREGILSLEPGARCAPSATTSPRPDVRAARAALGPAGAADRRRSWNASRRPGPSTASTRSSPRASATWTRHGREEWIDSLFKTYIRGATEKIAREMDWLVSVFTDNAGIIRFNDRYNLAYKVETHNSPSALDPYGGAITGIVGVNRDPMGTGMGCEMLCNVVGLLPRLALLRRRPARGADASAPHPRRRAPGRDRRRQPERHPLGARLRAVRRALPRQAAGLSAAPSAASRALLQGRPSERKEVAPGDADRHVRRPHRQGRHPRRDVLLRGAAQGIARAGGADRRPDHAAQACTSS